MKKVVLIALLGTMAAVNHVWAQTTESRSATIGPGAVALLETMAIVGKNRTATPAPNPPLQFFQAPAAPAPARPANAPAAPAPLRGARPAPASAPTPPAAPAAAVPAPPQSPLVGQVPAPARAGQPTPNVRFDVTITDTGGAKPVTKTLSLTIGSYNNNGSVRQTSQAPNPNPGPPTIPVTLNVDVRNVNWLDNNGVRASVAVEYQPYLPDAKTQPGMVGANATTVFFDGRRTQILMTSDPVSDRKTTIEVTATVLK